VTLLVDTSVWSLALGRDVEVEAPEDALIAQLCIRHDVILLSTDQDFVHAAKHSSLKVWSARAPRPG
jgi:predicted nucleic acid-binding protein